MNKMVERIGKTVTSGLVITGLVLGNGAFIQAEKVKKEESVYVNADASGTATMVTVSDWLKNAGVNGTVNDQSTLKDITNVKGDETFSQSGEGVQWSAGSEDIYYQGTTDQELPVGVSITYELDGAGISPQEIVGKSGTVKIRIAYTSRLKHQKTINGEKEQLYTPFLMATGVVLPAENFTDVEVDHGKVINEGTNNIVLGFGVPGMAESLDVDGELAQKMPEAFEITAKTTDFTMGNTITYASASVLADLEIEDDDTFEDLEDSLDLLVDSSEELVKGSKTLSESLGELKDKFEEFSDGEQELNEGVHSLQKNGKKLAKGVKDYTSGASSLAKGTQDYVGGAKKIVSGNKSLYEAVKEMPKSYKEFSDGIKQYTGGVDELANKETATALKNGAEGVSGGISKLNTGLGALQASYENVTLLVTSLRAQASQIENEAQKQTMLQTIQKLEELSAGQKASVASLAAATGEESELKSGANQVSAGIGKVLQGASAISEKSSALRSADAKMAASVQKLTANIQKLKKGGDKLSANDKKLLSGAKKIMKAGKSVQSGSRQLINGVGKLKTGSDSLDDATGKLSDGIGKLYDGGFDLYDGMNRFDSDGIQEINTKYEEDFRDLKDRLSALLDISKEYNNFSGIGDGMDGDVKFIIETEEIKKEEE